MCGLIWIFAGHTYHFVGFCHAVAHFIWQIVKQSWFVKIYCENNRKSKALKIWKLFLCILQLNKYSSAWCEFKAQIVKLLWLKTELQLPIKWLQHCNSNPLRFGIWGRMMFCTECEVTLTQWQVSSSHLMVPISSLMQWIIQVTKNFIRLTRQFLSPL